MADSKTDPLDINARLYKQLGKLLDDMEAADAAETMTFPQRINALIAVGRVQKMFVDLRKGEFSVGRGTAIERYAKAFATPHATGGRTDDARLSELDEDDLRDAIGDA
ncbi:MAG TPA: hypothetical protein VHT52_10510 [Stellaceae bacterium]|nr:hypothetical protein [Stellaceae bacterium]